MSGGGAYMSLANSFTMQATPPMVYTASQKAAY
jgi:hypothetical protein